MSILRIATTRVLIAAAVLGLYACSEVTAENYAKIEAGMDRAEVYALLGKPDDLSGGGFGQQTLSRESWRGPDHEVTVTFMNDSVTLKSIQPIED